MDYKETYEKWISSPTVNVEDKQILRSMSDEEIYEAFYKTAEFGTGGMRGIMGLGTNRLNKYTVRMAAKAMADMMPEKARVVVAYDTRNNSKAFAEETARVMAASGVKAYLFDRYSPVPLLSFAVRYLGADGGVVITASHNTSEYNGFKAYDETGCQMLTDKTEIIAANMESMEDPFGIEVASMDDAIIDTGLIVPIGDDVISAFMKEVSSCGRTLETTMPDLKVVYTSLHGSGRDYVMRALEEAGFSDVSLVPEQKEFDGDFPTVTKPNPEDPAALINAARMAEDTGADIIIGTDPDCDRVGVGVIDTDAYGGKKVTYLSGNQTGVLLIDYLCRITDNLPDSGLEKAGKRLITTIVTSELGPLVAKSHGIDVSYVLTGFKYIGGIMNQMEKAGRLGQFFMGYEESYGYLTGTHARDKDGVSSALAICRMAAYHKAQGKTLTGVLSEIYDRYGFWKDAQESLVFEGSEGEKIMKDIMAEFRNRQGRLFEDLRKDGESLTVRYGDFLMDGSGLPKADVLKYLFDDGSWVAVRPSGTEPKIKIYYCMCGADEEAATARQQEAAACISKLTEAFK